jgi:hypothetical protein
MLSPPVQTDNEAFILKTPENAPPALVLTAGARGAVRQRKRIWISPRAALGHGLLQVRAELFSATAQPVETNVAMTKVL